jgi:ankyrin repeat protein
MDILAEVRLGNIDALRTYLAEGNPVDFCDLEGSTLLHEATAFNHVNCVQLLLNSGARRDILNYCGHGSHPIHIATENGYVDIIKILIDDKNNISAYGSTPLHLAIQDDQFECARVLINSGADLNIRNWNNETPYELAKRLHCHDMLQYFDSMELPIKEPNCD